MEPKPITGRSGERLVSLRSTQPTHDRRTTCPGTALRTCVLQSSPGRLLPRLLPRRRRLLRSHRQQLSVLPHLEQPRRLDHVAELAIAVVARVERALVADVAAHPPRCDQPSSPCAASTALRRMRASAASPCSSCCVRALVVAAASRASPSGAPSFSRYRHTEHALTNGSRVFSPPKP